MKVEIDSSTGYLDFVANLHKTMQEQNLILIYQGEVNQDITKVFTSMAERNMEMNEESRKTSRQVYHVMIELLQNICKHTDGPTTDSMSDIGSSKEGIFIVANDDDNYYITSGNVTDSSNIPKVAKMIDQFNVMSKEEIKQEYVKLIKASKLSEKGGAGLGLIDIIKKTGNKIDYYHMDDKEGYSFLVQRSTVTRTSD